ncbi:hypothetical protein GCM10009839_32210 [Catenulispora yoronensis]|uniref:Uncharacterized protein n=1 Tax=Catenulispora yoronensis TaxID=450799 RepID=A0ABN2U5Y1_9ACTN
MQNGIAEVPAPAAVSLQVAPLVDPTNTVAATVSAWALDATKGTAVPEASAETAMSATRRRADTPCDATKKVGK